MTRSAVKVPLSTETVKGVGWRLESGANWSYAPLWKISGYATDPICKQSIATSWALPTKNIDDI